MIGNRSVLLEGSFCPAPTGPALQVLGLLRLCLIWFEQESDTPRVRNDWEGQHVNWASVYPPLRTDILWISGVLSRLLSESRRAFWNEFFDLKLEPSTGSGGKAGVRYLLSCLLRALEGIRTSAPNTSAEGRVHAQAQYWVGRPGKDASGCRRGCSLLRVP